MARETPIFLCFGKATGDRKQAPRLKWQTIANGGAKGKKNDTEMGLFLPDFPAFSGSGAGWKRLQVALDFLGEAQIALWDGTQLLEDPQPVDDLPMTGEFIALKIIDRSA